MRLIWYGGSHLNFGDDLNGVLWRRMAPELFDDSSRVGFLGIGTIIGRPVDNVDYLHVFSSGVGYDDLTKWTIARTIWCVRGPLSAQLLGEPKQAALTDGAILAPDVLGISPPPARTGVGLVPHWESELGGGWREAARLADVELISPIAEPADVFAAINRKSLVITESLHGAIVADALGVPWIAIGTTGNLSLFKWTDWALSVGVNLRIHGVASPSGKAIAKFGRFAGGAKSKEPLRPTASEAIEHFRGPGASGAPGALDHWKRRIKKGLLENSSAAAMLGFSPAAMAEDIARLAKAAPQLSDAQRRETLRDEMLTRFERLRNLDRKPSKQSLR